MKRILLVLGLGMCACGGASFGIGNGDAGDAGVDARADAPDAPDAQSVPDSSHPGDSGGAESSGDAAGDASEDTRMADDANAADATDARDSAAEAETGPISCGWPTFDCNGVTVTPPETFCLYTTGGGMQAQTTPIACATCSTYTCACLELNYTTCDPSCNSPSVGVVAMYCHQ